MAHLRSRPVPVLLAVVVLVASAAAAGAQTSPSSSPPTTAPSTAPPTRDNNGFLGILPATTTTTPPPSAAPTTRRSGAVGPAAPPGSPGAPPGAGGDGEPPPGTPRTVPPEFQRQIDSVRRTGPMNTTALIAALQPLVTELGMTPTDAALAGAGQFPIAGPTTWVDDWLFPRYVPAFHLHKGLDMFAPAGTPVRAPFDGVLKLTEGAVGGLAAYVTQPDGTYVYMAHMSGFAPDKVTGQAVRQGDVVGFVGDSGNARGGAPHVHLQLHPKGGNPAPPKPTVDQWLRDAERGAAQVVAAARAARNPAPGQPASASVTAVPEGTASLSADTDPAVDPAAALWAASSNPAIGTIDLASSLIASAAAGIAWPAPPG